MTKQELVEEVLKSNKWTRGSDRELILAVWQRQNHFFASNFVDFFKNQAIMPETITRARRKYQEKDKYAAVEGVKVARSNRAAKIRGTVAKAKRPGQVVGLVD